MCSKDCKSLLSTGWDPLPQSGQRRDDRRKIVEGGVITSQGVLTTSAKGLLTTRTLRLILSLHNIFCKDLKSLSEKRKARGPAMGFSRGDEWLPGKQVKDAV